MEVDGPVRAEPDDELQSNEENGEIESLYQG